MLKVEEESELIIGVFIEAIEKGDWRGAEPLLQRVYGRPQAKVEVSQPQSVAEVEQMSLAEIRQLRSRDGARLLRLIAATPPVESRSSSPHSSTDSQRGSAAGQQLEVELDAAGRDTGELELEREIIETTAIPEPGVRGER